MRNSPQRDDAATGMKMLLTIIIINVVMFLLVAPRGSEVYDELQLYCVKGNFHFFQLLTAGFLHHDILHILFNMYGLYLFGKLVAPHLGGRRFALLYLSGVLVGNALFLALNWDAAVALVGASGAVCAVMMAAAMLEPDQRFVMLFMPFTPIKTSTLIVCYTILEILMTLTSSESNVAHLAHLGGFVAGYLVLKLMYRGDLAWDPLRRKRKNIWVRPVTDDRPPKSETGFSGAPVSQWELDALLDKISRTGINSLTPQELARLKQAREQMRR